MRTIGLLHPGAMGATVGAAARAGGARVLWASERRSEATRGRAEAAGLEDAGDLKSLVARSDLVVSVCPPAAALEQARAVAQLGFSGVYLDANAVSPASARRVSEAFAGGPARIVDGGIVGPPARRPGTTRLYLSGEGAALVAEALGRGALDARAIDGPVGAASALKMAYASYTKGVTALLAAIHALASAEGVRDALLAEWRQSQPDLERRSSASIPASAQKAWRFVGEMEEIASSFEDAGLPGGFHRAAAEIYASSRTTRTPPSRPRSSR